MNIHRTCPLGSDQKGINYKPDRDYVFNILEEELLSLESQVRKISSNNLGLA